jgi:hypothetical protein
LGLVLSFRHARRGAHTLGPLDSVRLDACCLRERGDGPVLATHDNHQWSVAGSTYFSLECPARVMLHFEDAPGAARSRAYGPFGRFSAVDGIAFAEDRIVASIDRETLRWLAQHDGVLWRVLVLSEAGPARFEAKLFALGALCLASQLPGVYAVGEDERLVRIGSVASVAPSPRDERIRSRELVAKVRVTRARSRALLARAQSLCGAMGKPAAQGCGGEGGSGDSQAPGQGALAGDGPEARRDAPGPGVEIAPRHSHRRIAVSRIVSRLSLMRQRAFIEGCRTRRAPRAA